VRPAGRSLVLAVCLLAAGIGVALQLTGALAGVERDSVALRFSLRSTPKPTDITVVAIDDKTFADLRQQWPFPRSMHADAVDALHAAGAREIVYDVQFTEPTKEREDLALYDALDRAGGAVLATSEVDDGGRTSVLGGDRALAAIHAQAAAANLSDENGAIVARFPYSVSHLKTIAVAAAERISHRPVDPGRFSGGEARIDYRGRPGTFTTVSFSDLLDGRVDPALLRDRIVVVGASAPTLQDVHATPTSGSGVMSGPEVQANAIWTALHGIPLRDAPTWLGLGLALLLGLLSGLARLRLRVTASVAVAVAIGAAYAVAAQLAFARGWILPVVAPLAGLLLGTVAMVVVSHLAETLERVRVARDNEILERRVLERTEELRQTQLEIIQRLGVAAESRDQETGDHIARMSRLCQRLGLAVGMSETDAEQLRHAAAMHDIGKIGIPDSVLLKPGRLDADEWAVMKSHTTIGAGILAGSRSPLVQVAESIVLTHHERWDGSGYPRGLRGEEIPLEGRIAAICDVFDALITERVYKAAWSVDDALAELRRGAGGHFDPSLVEAFCALRDELAAEFARAPGTEAQAPSPSPRTAPA
jgi:response regulator RpfG family c-di-GMP phosphodiesterase